MYSTPKAGLAHARAHGLDAYLSGERSAPAAGSPVALPLLLLCRARAGLSAPHPQSLDAEADFRGDQTLAWGWWAAHKIATDATKRRRRPDAEYTARMQMYSLWEHLRARLEGQDFAFMSEAFDDGTFVSCAEDYALLIGILALCLMEAGVEEGRLFVRERAAERAALGTGGLYSRAILGLAGQSTMGWMPEQGCLGALEAALEWGGRCLEAALPEARADRERADAEAGRPGPRLRDLATTKEEDAETVDDGPSMIVLASVSHLPGAAEDGKAPTGRTTGSTARSEYAPLAGRRLPLARVPDLATARATLVAEFPDDGAVIDAVLLPLAGRAHVHIPPTLLVGPPGTGKSRLARRLGEALGLAVTVYGCAGVTDSSLIGTSRQWSTGRACVPLQAVKRADAASVLIVADELSRAGTRQDNGRLVDGLLALTERETARAYQDPYLECAVDLSAVCWLATANSRAGMDEALLSRFRVLEMRPRTAASLPTLARAIVADVRAERGLDEVWLPDLDGEEAEVLAGHWQGGSVRVLRRLIEALLASREQLAIRN